MLDASTGSFLKSVGGIGGSCGSSTPSGNGGFSPAFTAFMITAARYFAYFCRSLISSDDSPNTVRTSNN